MQMPPDRAEMSSMKQAGHRLPLVTHEEEISFDLVSRHKVMGREQSKFKVGDE